MFFFHFLIFFNKFFPFINSKIYSMAFFVQHPLGEKASFEYTITLLKWMVTSFEVKESVLQMKRRSKNFTNTIAQLVEKQKRAFFRFRNFPKYWICFLKLKMKTSDQTCFLFLLKIKTGNDKNK